ncbi:MAG: biotin/lipoyl-containing protein, partial [Steroidobacteraceae bacterium]
MARRITVSVPDLGDFKDVEVIDVLVTAGAEIAVESPLITLETDKATMDVPSTAAGRIAELRVKKGDRVSKGDPILVLEAAGAASGRPARGAAATPPAPTPAFAEPAVAATSAMIEVRVPDLGDFHDVEVIEILAAVGDTIALESPLVTLETEKATMDVPSSAAGTMVSLHVAKGARVNAGDLVATVQGTSAVPPAASATALPAAAGISRPVALTVADGSGPARTAAVDAGSSRTHAGPAVRQLARELGVDLVKVKGSGVKGRVTQDDVKAFVKRALTVPPEAATAAALPKIPDVDFGSFGPVEVRALGRIQKISGARLQASWVNIPHVTQHDEADITELEALRISLKERAAGLGIKLTPLAFVARACVRVIAQFPNFNSSIDAVGQNQVFKQYLHLGFAADTPNG